MCKVYMIKLQLLGSDHMPDVYAAKRVIKCHVTAGVLTTNSEVHNELSLVKGNKRFPHQHCRFQPRCSEIIPTFQWSVLPGVQFQMSR